VSVQRRPLRPARARAVALGTALAVGASLGGCSMFSEQTTQNVDYSPSDGSQAELGPIGVRNFVLLSQGEGQPATLIGSLFNSSDEDVQVAVTVAGGTDAQIFEVPASGSVTIGPEAEDQLRLDSIDVIPGLLVQVLVTDGEAQAQLSVPVLDGALPAYADLVPTGAATS